MYGEPSRYSTKSVARMADANCRSDASPTAVFQPCGMARRLWSSADHTIRRCSVSPPTLVTSGWTMSRAPASIHGPNDWRRVKTSPPEIGTAEAGAKRYVIAQGIWRQRLLEPGHVVVRQHVCSPTSPLEILSPEAVAGASVNHQCGKGQSVLRALATMASSMAALARPNGPQPILTARNLLSAPTPAFQRFAPARPSTPRHRQ